jgi:putative hydrolase of the HAD superfamily
MHQEFSSPDSIHHLYERGGTTLQALHESLVGRYGLGWDVDEFGRQFNDFFERNPPMENLLNLLKPQAALWALSNTNATHLAHFETAYPFFSLFRGIMASHEMGLRKPDPRIYRLALERMACRPEEVFFIDDSQANVESARKTGITAFHYTFNDPELRTALRSVGFILP